MRERDDCVADTVVCVFVHAVFFLVLCMRENVHLLNFTLQILLSCDRGSHRVLDVREQQFRQYHNSVSCKVQWRLFIIISRASKWRTLKSAGNPRCAVHAEIHLTCTDRPRPGPATGARVSPTSDTCQSVAILMNRRHC